MPVMCSDVTCLINVYHIKSNQIQGKNLLNEILFEKKYFHMRKCENI